MSRNVQSRYAATPARMGEPLLAGVQWTPSKAAASRGRSGAAKRRDMDSCPADRMFTPNVPLAPIASHIVDPSRSLEIEGDLLIADGVIREAKRGIGAAGVPEGTEVIDCKGRMVAPGLVATSVFAFITSWNEYIFASVLLSDQSNHTVTVWLSYFYGTSRNTDWGGLMAASTLTAIPVIVFFLLVQRRIMFGLTSGDVRG